MIDVTMDMEQYDCPFIETTDDHDVTFRALQWDFDSSTRELETRMMVEGRSRNSLEAGLATLQAHANMHQCDLFKKHGDVALIKTTIAETNAMRVIRNNGGFITGPFEIEAGSERWEVGFDDAGVADDTLSELEVNNEFSVEERNSLELDPMFDLMKNTDAAETLLEACRALSETERQTLAVAAEKGYFNQPRGATLQMLANEFDVSDTAVSKNVRRAERKILKRVVDAMDTIEDTR